MNILSRGFLFPVLENPRAKSKINFFYRIRYGQCTENPEQVLDNGKLSRRSTDRNLFCDRQENE